MSEKVELFAPGSLGTCWYGKYHYMEPWVGCQHNCPYCYARSRNAVLQSLSDCRAKFEDPVLQQPEDELLADIAKTANSGEINILKLCRYTDIFTPKFVENGLSLKIMKLIAGPESKIKRIIITTKGLPNEDLIEFMSANPEKFSYNAAVRPSGLLPNSSLIAFDKNLYPVEDRLRVASRLQKAGLKTTIHCDPFSATVDDSDEALLPFLDMLDKYGLKRVMWSYLLLSPGIIETIRETVPEEAVEDLLTRYDFDKSRMVLPKQEDTVSYSQLNELSLASAQKMADLLLARDFQFVLCSLKSIRGLNLKQYPRSMICDGTFYA